MKGRKEDDEIKEKDTRRGGTRKMWKWRGIKQKKYKRKK